MLTTISEDTTVNVIEFEEADDVFPEPSTTELDRIFPAETRENTKTLRVQESVKNFEDLVSASKKTEAAEKTRIESVRDQVILRTRAHRFNSGGDKPKRRISSLDDMDLGRFMLLLVAFYHCFFRYLQFVFHFATVVLNLEKNS